MASDTAYTAIRNYVAGAWTATPIGYENEKFTRPNVTDANPVWVEFEVVGTLYEQASIGADDPAANLWREEGVIFFHVFVPANTGTATARTYARQLAQLFKGVALTGMWFGAASIGAGSVSDEDGNWWRITVTVEFTRDET